MTVERVLAVAHIASGSFEPVRSGTIDHVGVEIGWWDLSERRRDSVSKQVWWLLLMTPHCVSRRQS